jgi:hypothetical protein
MSEAWAIALVTIGSTLFLAVLGWIAYELRGIHKDMKFFVLKDNCNLSMGKHCQEIENLKKGFEENKSAINQMVLSFKREHDIEIKYEG